MTLHGPWASIHPSRHAAREQSRRDAPTDSGAAAGTREAPAYGPWRLGVTDRGDLVAEHDNGTVRVLATTEEG